MVFSSPIFIFLFLPIVLALTLLIRKEFRNFILLISSLFFYAWGEPEIVLLMLISILFNYLFGLIIDKYNKYSKITLAVCLIFNIGILIFFKYFNFIINNVNHIILFINFKNIEIDPIHLPIGISFFTFQIMSYVIDVYRKDSEVQKNPLNIALYISFFPQLIAGPIVRYHDIALQINERTINIDKFSNGIQRFIIGLGKKVLIANILGKVADDIFSIPAINLNPGLSWLGIISYALQIYYDFSGYSDMAIGLGFMFGFHFLENFNYPYISGSIKEFWRRWHISLSTWFKDYLYIPLGGNRKGKILTFINLLIVFFLTGLWHGANWTFIFWGLFHGFFLILERAGMEKILSKIWFPIRNIYTIFIVIIGWVFFRSENFSYALNFIKAMFGFTNPVNNQNDISFYLNTKILLVLVCGILFSYPTISYLKKYFTDLKDKIKIENIKSISYFIIIIKISIIFIIFLLSIISISSDTYNPFIYFRF